MATIQQPAMQFVVLRGLDPAGDGGAHEIDVANGPSEIVSDGAILWAASDNEQRN
jgi:hypothetical protein